MYFLKVIVFWDVTPYDLADNCELLRGTSWVEVSGLAKIFIFVYKRSWSQSHYENLISFSSFISVLSDTDTCWLLPAFSFGICTFPMLLWSLSYVQPFCFRHFLFNIGLSASMCPVSSYFLEICGL
jgi:hypothetical protein